MANYQYELSWKAAFKTYGYRQLAKDSFLPFTLSVILVILSSVQDKFTQVELIQKVCDILISMMPDIISILIAGFAIWISFFLSSTIDFIKNDEDGIIILHELNAAFLIEIAFSVMGLIFALIIANLGWFQFSTNLVDLATVLNFAVLFMLLFISFAVVWWLIYIAKNLHNVAKFTILYERITEKSKNK